MSNRGPARRALSTCLVLAVLVIASCAGRPHPTLGELKKLPAASIVYPGSVGPGAGGTDSNNKFGPNAAVFVRIELTNATTEQIQTFYQQQLLADGWTSNNAAAGGNPNWTTSWGWTKGKRSIALGILNGDYLARLHHDNAQYGAYAVAYEIDLQ